MSGGIRPSRAFSTASVIAADRQLDNNSFSVVWLNGRSQIEGSININQWRSN